MGSGKVLLVEDKPAACAPAAALLQQLGYEPTTIVGSEPALHLLPQQPGFDLVLAELMTTESDGLNLLERIGAAQPTLPVVILTDRNDIHLATSAFRRGAIDYLLKPFETAHLEATVNRAIKLGQTHQQEAAYKKSLEQMVAARTWRLRATMKDLEKSYDITLEAMGDALDLRDAETQGHSRRVTAYTIALARAMGLSVDALRTIARGAFLHDIGKIATPDSILLKPGKLNRDEVAVMREHCTQGYQIVRKIPFLREASEIVYTHQERFDGSGYPRGLKGDQIPLGSRIFAVADTLDAITSDRPYRKGASVAAANHEIARCSGQQFDPSIVRVFLGLPSNLWGDLRTEVSLLATDPLAAPRPHPSVA
jgi:putative nucleotidyltransferase with HDIG domain